MDDDHALDAAFAWLDGKSLLRAAAVCRRWRERATRREAWRDRVAGVGWTRGMHPRDAYVRSLRVRARWRRRRVVVTELPAACEVLCADGDWLACRHQAMLPRAAGDGDSDDFYAWTPRVRIYDAAAARTVADLPVDARAAALSREHGRCATLQLTRDTDPPGPMTYRGTCTVWAPDPSGECWRTTGSLALDRPMSYGNATVHWHDGRLLVHDNGFAENIHLPYYMEWFDVGAGGVRSVARREYGHASLHGRFARSGPLAYVVNGSAIYAVDPRMPAGGDLASPLITMRCPSVRGGGCSSVASADDGRHIVVLRSADVGHGNACVELWDVRAARTDATPVAELRLSGWQRALCATARGTVLGCAGDPWPMRHGNCSIAINEWDPVRGATQALLVVRGSAHTKSYECTWADERRAVVKYGSQTTLLFDADPAEPLPR